MICWAALPVRRRSWASSQADLEHHVVEHVHARGKKSRDHEFLQVQGVVAAGGHHAHRVAHAKAEALCHCAAHDEVARPAQVPAARKDRLLQEKKFLLLFRIAGKRERRLVEALRWKEARRR